MNGSTKRVSTLINGGTPDRPPLFELLRNDKAISHFVGEKLTVKNGEEVVFKAYGAAVDGTRPRIALPQKEAVKTRPDGRKQKDYRWTSWVDHVQYNDVNDYEKAKRKVIDSFDPAWSHNDEKSLQKHLKEYNSMKNKLGDVFLFATVPNQSLATLYCEVGLEIFSYYMVDCPDIIDELLELQTVKAIRWAEHLPDDHGLEACFMGEDMAFNNGTFFPPSWLRKYFFPRLQRVISAYHKRGIKVMFHSDGNLNEVLDNLVEAGIDGLNPIEIVAGMDVGKIHNSYPHLFMAGGIDVSYLLPLGKPEEVKDAVKKAIDVAEGRLMVGCSTELNNAVPLENYLALRDTVLEFAGN